MLEKSFGLFYFLKQPKTTKRPNHYVYLRITVDGVCRDISIKRQWSTSRWDQSTGRATGTKLDAKSINAYIETLSAKVYQAKLSLIENDKIITADSLKNKITGRGDETKMLLQLIVKHNKKMEALIGNGYSLATLKRYQTIHQHTKNFIMWKYGVNDFSINELNYEFGAEYVFWLKAFKNCANNSVIKYVSNLKKIVMECVRKGWLKNDPFIELRFIKDDVIRVALTKDELTTITNKTFITDRLNNVKDIFLFSCYTGLAYVDIFNLRRSQIVRGIDDFLWINIQRQKTGTLSRLPLLPVAFGIMNKYNDHPKCADESYVLPVLTNQKMNAYLKEIADICGITTNLTFHIARHTFATTITLNNGVPIETVSKMLGHKSLQQTQHYAKILDCKVSEDMILLRKKLSFV
ncbi:site-specific integrase [Mucilaginibacter sp. X5P1]|uniref:site-specific integrase n=1 Tax=Mucilaginibacter sp. X5P1 TaxID=2723088 RepID=UPI00161F6C6E|nr:site-specific integrase [Mucilaginibacter sp. X5P1]MBB6140224.1 site-specific recombinase XerD [Mucilaginibacter sp. X5P1]